MRDRVRVAAGSDVYLGMDISKSSWHVMARSGGETLLSASFPPKKEALNGLLKRLCAAQRVRVWAVRLRIARLVAILPGGLDGGFGGARAW